MVGGNHQQHRCGMGAGTERVLPLQVREALRESCALGTGGLVGGSGLGKRPARAREQPGLCTIVAWAGRDGVHLLWERLRSEFWEYP